MKVARGGKKDDLLLSLGLDLAELEADFITADKTVSQGMQEISRKAAQAKLRMEIDLSAFKGAENSAEALKIKEKALNEQLELQKQKVLIVNAAYKRSVQDKGEANVASQKMYTTLLREQKAQAELAAQLKATMAARAGRGVSMPTSPLNVVSAGASAAIGTATGSFAALQAKMAAVMAIALAGAGLFNVVRAATASGEAVYQLSNKLHLTTGESAELNRILAMGNVDSQAFIGTMIRLDRAVGTAGKNGNTTTKSLEEFGVSLTDDTGKLLPMNQQLDRLAFGYANAAKAGQEEAYAAEVLGNRGQALIPLLQQYNDLKEASSKVTTTGLTDPASAHDLSIEFKILSMEASQLGNAFGAALIPVAKEVAPLIIDAMKSVIYSVRENKEAIVLTSAAVGDLVRELGMVTGEGFGVLSDTGITLRNVLQEITLEMRAISLLFSNPALKWNGSGFDTLRTQAEKELAAEKKLRDERKTAIEEAKKIPDDPMLANAKSNMQAKSNAQRKLVEDAKASAKTMEEIATAQYHSSHTALENEIFDIEEKARGSIKEGVSEARAWELAELQKATAVKKANEQIAETNAEVENQLYGITHNQLEAQLHDIDVKTSAYIKKGADEVKVTQLAEAQKAKAIEKCNEEVSMSYDKLTRSSLENDLKSIEKRKQEREKAGVEEVAAERLSAAEMAAVRQQYANEIVEALYKETHDSQQNRLFDLEKEKIAMIDKYGDDYNVFKLFEAKKKAAIKQNQEDVKQQVASEYGTELDAVKKALTKGADIEKAYKKAHDLAVQRKKIDEEALNFVQSKSGLRSRVEIAMPEGYQSQKDAIKKGLSDMTDAGAAGAQSYFSAWQDKVNAIKGQMGSIGGVAEGMSNLLARQSIPAPSSISISVTMPVSANINNDMDVEKLKSELAASVINPIKQALAGNESSYGG